MLSTVPAPEQISVPAYSELRFYVAAEGTGTLKLMEGSAELFGIELALGKEYVMTSGKSGSIATFFGAKVSELCHLF